MAKVAPPRENARKAPKSGASGGAADRSGPEDAAPIAGIGASDGAREAPREAVGRQPVECGADLDAVVGQLASAKAELQLLNEELRATNEEIGIKSAELESIATDLASLRDSLTFPLLAVDRLLRVTSHNRACDRIMDVGEGPAGHLLIGRPLHALHWKIPSSGLEGDIEQVIGSGRRVTRDIGGADGLELRLVVVPYRSSRDAVDGAVLMFADVSAARHAQRELEASEEKFRNLVRYSPIGKCMELPGGEMTVANPKLSALLGVDEPELIGRRFEDFVHPADVSRVVGLRRAAAAAAGESAGHPIEVRLHRFDGDDHWVMVACSAVRDARGGTSATITHVIDIDEMHRTREQRDDLAEKYRLATEVGLVGVWERNLADDALLWDATIASIHGVDRGDGRFDYDWWLGRIVKADRARVKRLMARAIATCETTEIEFRITHADGSLRHIVSRSRVLCDAAGRPGRQIGTCIEVTELREFAERLAIESRAHREAARESAARAEENRLLTDAVAHGVLAITPDGTIRSANRAIETIFGYSEKELVGRKVEVLVPPGSRAAHPAMRQALHLPEATMVAMAPQRNVRGLHRDGTEIPCEIQLRHSSPGADPGIVASIYDLRARIEHEAAADRARRAAEEATLAKSQFLATMSHEIRTPMNVVLGMLELIGRTELTGEQRDLIDKVRFATRTLRSIIDDVLDFSKIEAERLTLECEPFNPVDLINAVVEEIAATLTVSNRALELIVEISPDLPDALRGDALRLHQVLLNLLSNAVKFTPSGSVTLGLRLIRRTARKACIEFSVTDTGIGISADKIEAIFEGFQQAEASTARRFGGTGLGLAISQRLVQLMGSTIAVESVVDRGSRFSFALDLPITTVDHLLPALTDAIHGTRDLHLLVVDDQRDNREYIARMASQLGWQVDCVNSGTEAIAKLADVGGQTLPYDLVLIDWQMPHMDGWETAQRVRQVARGLEVAMFVLVSAYDISEFRSRRLDAQSPFDGYVSKPVTLPVLLRLALGVLRKRKDARARETKTRQREQRLAGLHVLVAEDFALNQELLRGLLEQEGAHVDIAGDGRTALAMLEDGGKPCDIVLMDVQMPEMDGIEACRVLRRQQGWAHLPVLAITANAQESDRLRCIEAGMDDYVAKPIEIEDLVAKIVGLTRRGQNMAIALAGDGLGHDRRLVEPERFATARRLLSRASGDGLPRHVESLEALIAEISTGRDDLTAMELAALCHKLTGGAGALGALPLAEAARACECALRDCEAPAGGLGADLRATLDSLQRLARETMQAFAAL